MFKQIKNKYAKEEFLLDAGHHPDLRHVVKIQHSGIICTSPGGGSGWAGMTGTCHIRQCKDMALF